ncbi:heterokaryon incompatibility protein-domain-containing protein [Nemania sp. FL0916]|nr:heterokaryon incompatibility protein-domain-containing protein [Nemania sp. FL0916]
MSSFNYPPLTTEEDAIRVLKLEPGGHFSDPLVGTLTQVAFGERPKYVAISYTWGDPYPDRSWELSSSGRKPPKRKSPMPKRKSITTSITVNTEPLQISCNLYLALRHLRSSTHSITLWVDAICINQADTDERNHQVSLMSFIFTRATMVVAWIGTKYARTDYQSQQWKAGEVRHLAATLVGEGMPRYSPRPESYVVSCIGDSAYWTRLWVVQEVCLPHVLVLVYGSKIWTYESFASWTPRPETSNTPTAMMRLFEAREERHTETMRLEILVEKFASSRCSELRDRVFGLLGCANDIHSIPGHKANSKALTRKSPAPVSSNDSYADGEVLGGSGSFRIDYTSSFYRIWADLVKFFFFQAKTMEGRFFITNIEYYRATNMKLILNEERAISIVRAASVVQNALSQQVEEEIINNCIAGKKDSTLIRAVGYVAGKVVHLGPEYSSLMGSYRAQQEWISCWSGHYHAAKDMEMIRRLGEDYTAKLLDCKESDIDRVRNFQNSKVVAWPATMPLTSHDYDYIMRDYMIRDIEIWADVPSEEREPRMCLGTGYVMGLVPPVTKPGDIVVRFWDCDVAVVLRPTTQVSLANGTREWLCSLLGRADIADVYDRKATPGRDLRAEECMLSNEPPGFPKTPTGQFPDPQGLISINLDMETLQMITANIST